MTTPRSPRRWRRAGWPALVLDAALVTTVLLPWRRVSVSAPALPAGHQVRALGIAATGRALAAVHRTLAAQSVVWAALEILVLGAALGGILLMAIPGSTPGRRRAARFLALGAAACAALACWAIPALGPTGPLSVHLVAEVTPAAYAGFGASLAALVATVAATGPTSPAPSSSTTSGRTEPSAASPPSPAPPVPAGRAMLDA